MQTSSRAISTTRRPRSPPCKLRTQRDYVDQRRANVKIFDARRSIDAAVKALKDAGTKAQAKDAAPADFAAVKSAGEAVKKLTDENRTFGKQDAKFAAYVTATDATVDSQLKAADDHETQLAVDKQRVFVEAGRASLKDALASITKDATDGQFKAADTASSALAKRLEDGKPLEAKNKAYQADAAKVRAELTAAKQKADAMWSATGLARLKAEIAPQYADLVAAARPLHGKPTEDQIAEAHTAALVVRGLVEKFQPEAERSQAFGQYVDSVRKGLIDAETLMETRALTAAQVEVGIAQRNIEKKTPQPTDEQFQELGTALSVLEKTLTTVHAKEPLMAKTVGESEWVAKEGHKVMERRRLEVDVERQMGKVEDARKISATAMQQLQQANFGHEQIQQAEAGVKLIGTMLDQGNPLLEKDRNYAYYDGEVKKRVAEANDKIAAKKIVLAASEAGAALAETLATAKAKIAALGAPEGKDADIEAATKSVEAILALLEAKSALEKQNGTYAARAGKARGDMDTINDQLDFAKMQRELRKKTGETLALGVTARDQGTAMKDLHGRKGQYEKALGLFRSCQSEGTQLTKMVPTLAKIPVLYDGKSLSPNQVMDQCTQRSTETEELMANVAPLIKFEDGPKKSYEAGKALLDKSKKTEALAQYNECIATGILLQHDHPEMTDSKFDVAGGSITLGDIIKQCVDKRKSLLPK